MLKSATPRPAQVPLKLLLLNSSPEQAGEIQTQLDGMLDQGYTLRCMQDLDALGTQQATPDYDTVLLDIRADRTPPISSIRTIAEHAGLGTLICLCNTHDQLKPYGEVLHLIDDYIVPHTQSEGELAMRITHAIRRRGNELELSNERELYESLMDNIPDAIYFKDLNSRFTKVNRAMTEIYGNDAQTIIGLADFDLFSEEHARPAFEDEQQIIQTGKPIIGKVEKETFADGRVSWVTTTKLPLYNHSRKIIGTMGISRNITELKSIEDALQAERAPCCGLYSVTCQTRFS